MPYSLLTFGTVNRSAEKRCVRFFILFISLRTEKCEDFRRCHGEWLLGHGHSTGHVVVFSAFFFFFFTEWRQSIWLMLKQGHEHTVQASYSAGLFPL